MRILLISKETGLYANWFPLSIAYVAAALIKNGYEVEAYCQDMHHYPDEHLTEYLDRNHFDVVGVGAIGGYYQYKRLIQISQAINNSKKRPFLVLGGHCVSPEPEYFLRKTQADVVVIGEAEITIVALVEAIDSGRSLANVKGIAYWNGDKIIVNEDRELIEDIDSIPLPAYSLFPIEYYRLFRGRLVKKTEFTMPVLTGRGCSFKCTFCYRMDKSFRQRSAESITEEIKFLKKNHRINYIYFSDELLMSSVERTVSLCEAFLKAGLNVSWTCNGRLNYAKPDVLRIMKESGCVFINYGIESMDDEVLRNMNKALTTKQIIDGVENTLAAGISPGLNIIFGNIGDNKKVLNKSVEFLLKYDDGAQLRTIKPVTPYPGSPLYDRAIEKGLIVDCEDFYENKHVNSDLPTVNFTELDDDEFLRCLYEANSSILRNYFNKQFHSYDEQAKKLYFEKDTGFRGFRQR